MGEAGFNKANDEMGAQSKLTQYEREVRRLNREITHMKHAISQEKTAYTTILNQQKASTFIMRERERYLTLLLANSPSIILFLSQAERIEFCTDYFVAKAGYSHASDVLGHTLMEVLAPFLDDESYEKLRGQSRAVTRTGEPASFNVTFNFKGNGHTEDFDGLLVPMNDEQHNSNGLMLMLHDVTDMKRSREEALAASQAKSTFLSNMSHEMRTPMNAIMGMTSIGMKEADPKRKDYAFGRIESASAHLLGVINDILDISKIESGKMELSDIVFNFTQMLDRVISVITVKMQDKGQRFALETDPEIPASLFGDDQHLAQVITNLLSNAVKFTPEGGSIEMHARLLSVQGDRCLVQMAVKDSGIGMSKEEQGKLFSPFQQAEAGTSRKFGGTGLGLAISKRIIEMMGGEIRVQSEPGEGSCFTFTVNFGIPDQSEAAEKARIKQSVESHGIQDFDFSGKSVLIVDDVEINLEIVLALLEPTNITADTATNGKEAVDTFAGCPERYDLILMDMQMPGIDGLQATRIIRGLDVPRAATIPIVAMTANVFKEDIKKCTDAGMNGHLGKPIVPDHVMRVLASYL